MSAHLKLCDLPGRNWPELADLRTTIERGTAGRPARTVRDYAEEHFISWVQKPSQADALIRRAELSDYSLTSIAAEQAYWADEALAAKTLFLIGEPRELSPAAYMRASEISSQTLSVAPGEEFERFLFGKPWSDPELEGWSKRLDRFCWIARPMPHRVALLQRLLALGIEVDIYSHQRWPLGNWRGPAEDDVETAKAYKYRIACENYPTNLYHSEKLFLGVKSGCVSFYCADPQLDLAFAPGISSASLLLTNENLKEREALSAAVLKGIEEFMFTDRWEVYSYRSFLDLVFSKIRFLLSQRQHSTKEIS